MATSATPWIQRGVVLTLLVLAILLMGMTTPTSGRTMVNVNGYHAPALVQKQRLLWCTIPKCGSTTTRTFLYRVLHAGKPVTSALAHRWYRAGRNEAGVRRLRPNEYEPVYNDPLIRKLVIIRHPVEKLLSAFLSKKGNGELFNWYKWMPRTATFKFFVHNLVAKESSCDDFNPRSNIPLRDDHWLDQYCYCGLKEHKDKFELFTISEASEKIRDLIDDGRLDINEPALYGFGSHNEELFRFKTNHGMLESKADTRRKICAHYDNELIDFVQNMYKFDMDFFGFDWNKFRCDQ